ncbi:MAG TPA: TetR/AcrR family transcriptional regulator [Hyphomicrobiaceae bacterium]|jgi:AcrR family transcriptional regulator|nr:TetR/AcrR family transcriptional regulator [Hyphomicrobiaceae bacterium]
MLKETPRKRTDTRERVLDIAEAAVLQKGFSATSIDELIAAAGITKSGFFYHFKDKTDLAKSLMQRYIAANDAILDDIMGRADELNDDPLHGFLVSLKLFAELLADLPGGHPGCLVASFCYQDQLFNGDIRDLARAGVDGWRRRFRDRLELIAARYPPRIAIDIDELADMANALVDGGIIMGKVFQDPAILPKQVLLYRDLIRLIFQPA